MHTSEGCSGGPEVFTSLHQCAVDSVVLPLFSCSEKMDLFSDVVIQGF
jgi:hypothetical protein